MSKAVIFDMDGVIIKSEPLWEKTEKILLKSKDIEYTPIYRDRIVGLNQNDSAKLLIDTFNLKDSISTIIQQRIQILLKIYKNELNLTKGLENLLIQIKNKKVLIGLASSSPIEVIQYVLEKFSIYKYFDTVVSGECTKKGKPNPDIYLLTAKNLKVKPEQCLVIEDSINGVKSAKSAGMYCIAIPEKRFKINEFAIADKIINNLEEIELDKILSINF